MRIGLIVNPIAGMGGFVGLKGTDGPGTAAKARRMGARPTAAERTKRAMLVLKSSDADCEFVTPDGDMGANILRELGVEHEAFPLSRMNLRLARPRRQRTNAAVEMQMSSCSAEATALRETWRKPSA